MQQEYMNSDTGKEQYSVYYTGNHIKATPDEQ